MTTVRLAAILVTLGCLTASAPAQAARAKCPVTAAQVTAAAKKPMRRIYSGMASPRALCTFADVASTEPFRLTIFSPVLGGFGGSGIRGPVDTNWGPHTGFNFGFLGASGRTWGFTLIVSSAFYPLQASDLEIVSRLRHSQAW